MKSIRKIRVAVLYGGCSAEHEISLQSAANVIQCLDHDRFSIIPVGIDKRGNWHLNKEVFFNDLKMIDLSLNLSTDKEILFTPQCLIKPTISTLSKELAIRKKDGRIFDVFFPVIHGSLCEDGAIQGLLELANLPYVGCGVLASAIGMDKDVAKRLAASAGIKVGPYLTLKKGKWLSIAKEFEKTVESVLSYPVFVKPANAGSSIGISKVNTSKELLNAIEVAFQYDEKLLIEKAIDAIELEIAVLESLEEESGPIVSVVGEVHPHDEFYSYRSKYLDKEGARIVIPTVQEDSVISEARKIAQDIFLALECTGMARVDLFFNRKDKQLYFNEINTIPGFTKISMYPKLLEATGIAYRDLLSHLIDLAIKRNESKTKLVRSYS